jgi:magnesium transporter
MSNKHYVRPSKKRKPRFRRRTPPGAVPGTVVVDPAAPHPVIQVMAYGPDGFREQKVDNLDSLAAMVGKAPVTWVHVQWLGDAATIERLGQIFGLHPLALEDVVNSHQNAKVEDYGDHLFIVARTINVAPGPETEQLSIFLGRNFVITFDEQPGDCLDPLRQRLRTDRARIRQLGADYLAYALLDAVVDGYFPVLERYGETLDRLDDEITTQTARVAVTQIHDLRGNLLVMRRAIWPLRDAVAALAREPNRLIAAETRVFLRDCYDHTVQIIDLVETSREMCSDLRDFYLSAVNNRMSEVMKVLTMIATLFIPMSFVAGLYGMNFDPGASPLNMPELRWYLGYPFALGLMAALATWQLVLFWRRGWFRS